MAEAEQADASPAADLNTPPTSTRDNDVEVEADVELVVEAKTEVPEELSLKALDAETEEGETTQPEAVELESVVQAESETTTQPVLEDSPKIEESTEEPTKEESADSPVELQPLSKTESLSPTLPDDPIAAIDALEDAIEEVGKILPSLDQPLSPVKPRSTKTISTKEKEPAETVKPSVSATTKAGSSKSLIGRATSVRGIPSPRLANTTQSSLPSRIRAAPTTVTTSTNPLARSTASTNPLARSTASANPLARSTASTNSLARSTSTRTRPTSTMIPPGQTQQSNNKPDHLAAKRRPISVQFPTPPPPPKSTKEPTKATFTLPGEALAAKFKAAREERVKRQEEEAAKKKAFKARPIPASTKTKPVEVKQTATTRARLSTIGGADSVGNKENNFAQTGLNRSATVTGATSKRGSIFGASTTKRPGMMGPTSAATQKVSSTNTAPKRINTVAANKDLPSSLSVSKRASPSISKLTGHRVSSIPSPISAKSRTLSTTKPPMTADDVSQRQKGKAVFNKDRGEKGAKEQDRKEKDEAMKKARAEAAERGRQASREWAEKQKNATLEAGKSKNTATPETEVVEKTDSAEDPVLVQEVSPPAAVAV
jgi:hypothetical protein